MIFQLLLSGAEEGSLRLLEGLRTAGVNQVQLRAPGEAAGEILRRAESLAEICRELDMLLVVNDRVDVALAVGAGAVQLGERSLPPGIVRRLVGPGVLIGRSVHGPTGENREGADYLVFGSVFPTPSHPGEEPVGLSALAETVRGSRVPVLAIGGIGPREAGSVRRTGAAGIVVRSAILAAPDPLAAAQEIHRRWEDAGDG